MAGSTISYKELFDFEGFSDAISELKKETSSLDDIFRGLTKESKNFSDIFQDKIDGLISGLRETKKEIGSIKDISFGKKLESEIREAGNSVLNLREAQKALKETVDVSGGSITSLKAKLSEIKKLYADLDPAIEADRKRMIELQAEYQQTAGKVLELKKALEKTEVDISYAEDSYLGMSKRLSELRAQLKALPNAFDSTTGALNENNQEAVALNKTIQQLDKAVKAADFSMGQFGRNVGNYYETSISLKKQLLSLNEELARMKLEGKENTDEYKNLIEKAGELRNTLSNVSAEIKRVGSDTSTIEGIAGAFEGVAGAAAAAQGATDLFGSENDDLIQSIQRLQALQAVMLGIQSVANALQKESAAVLLFVNAQRKLEILYTNLSTAAESKNIIVRKAATVAQWALNTAMKANPVGLLITAVALLAGVVLLFANRTQKAAEAQIKLNEVQKNYFDLLDRRSSKIEEEGQKRISAIEDELKLAKARGASDLEIMSIEQKLAETRNENAAKQKGYWSEEIKNIDAIQNSYNGYLDYVNRLKNARTQGVKTSVITNYQTNTTENKKVSEEDITAAEGIAENLKDRLDRALKVRENYENAGTDLSAKALEKRRLDIERDWKSRIALNEAEIAKTKEDSLEELRSQEKLLAIKRDNELRNVNLTDAEKFNIEAQYQKAVLKLNENYDEKISKSQANSRISLINAQLSFVKAGSDEELKLKKQLIDEQANLELISIQYSIHNEKEKQSKISEINAKALEDKRTMEREKLKAEHDYQVKSLRDQLELKKLKDQIASTDPSSSILDKSTARKNLSKYPAFSIGLFDKELEYLESHKDDLFRTEEDYQNAIIELQKEKAEEQLRIAQDRADKEMQIQDSIIQMTISGLNAAVEIYKYNSDSRIAKIEQEKEASISAAGDNAAAKERIEKAFNKKIAAEKRKQAQADKAAALFNIAISTAQAVAKIWAEVPKADFGVSTIILTGLAIAQGAIQAALVASKPIPKFWKGTQNAPEGPALVNDEPGSIYQELIVRDRKAYLPSKRNQLVNLKRGDKVIPAMRTAQILSSAERNMEMQRLLAGQTLNNTLSEKLDIGRKLEVEHTMMNALLATRINEKEIGLEVGKQISKLPVEQNIWDDAGYQKRIRKGNTTINYLNKRNSL